MKGVAPAPAVHDECHGHCRQQGTGVADQNNQPGHGREFAQAKPVGLQFDQTDINDADAQRGDEPARIQAGEGAGEREDQCADRRNQQGKADDPARAEAVGHDPGRQLQHGIGPEIDRRQQTEVGGALDRKIAH